jgi:ubiquinone/menaquinone biosynthesis C-methylase UbiE
MDQNEVILKVHREKMYEGQSNYFLVTNDGRLIPRSGQRFWLETHRQKMTKLLSIQVTDCFVDVGCGEGYYTIHLAAKAQKSFGFDLVNSGLDVLRGQQDFNPNKLKLAIANGDAIPLQDGIADKVLCNHMLEHVIDDKAIIREIHRILKPSGRALIGVPLALSPQVIFLLRLRRVILPQAPIIQLEKVKPGELVPELIGINSHIRFYSLKTLKNLLSTNGFHLLRAEGIGLSMRGRWSRLIRSSNCLMSLFNALAMVWPAIGDGVLVLVEKK